jgi:hypothetical protein
LYLSGGIYFGYFVKNELNFLFGRILKIIYPANHLISLINGSDFTLHFSPFTPYAILQAL